MTSHPAAEPATVQSGDLVLLDYELWSESGGREELIDTSREEAAQKAELKVPEGFAFGPKPHLIGGDFFPGGIESALAGITLGTEVVKEFAPADAFGERDPKLIELFSMSEIQRLPEMRRDDAHLDLGTILTIKGRRGRVTTLTAARVRVDFNPPYSGKKIRGKFKVVERIKEPAEQVRALVELTYGRGKEFQIEVHQGTVTLKVPDRAKFDVQWLAAKPRAIDKIRTHLKPTTIQVTEEYHTPVAKEKVPETPKAPSEPAAAPATSPP
ncbi:MAG: peptidylprolyl isomerase [Candidatus Lutacidiplasmatales archaeon]